MLKQWYPLAEDKDGIETFITSILLTKKGLPQQFWRFPVYVYLEIEI